MKYFSNIIKEISELKHKDPNYIRFGALSHKYTFQDKLDEVEVISFEEKIEVRLPNDYREFIINIGNGGAGPCYGIQKVDLLNPTDFRLTNNANLVLDKPFTHINDEWNEEWVMSFDWENDRPDDILLENYWDTKHISGAIPICHYGHGDAYLLIINGYDKGRIWFDGRGNYSGLFPELIKGNKVTFSEWYLSWLTEILNST